MLVTIDDSTKKRNKDVPYNDLTTGTVIKHKYSGATEYVIVMKTYKELIVVWEGSFGIGSIPKEEYTASYMVLEGRNIEKITFNFKRDI